MRPDNPREQPAIATAKRLMRLFAKCGMNPAKAMTTHEAWAQQNPAAARREARIAAKECPKYAHKAERLCTCVVNGELRWLVAPGIDLCDRCWQRAERRGLMPAPEATPEETMDSITQLIDSAFGKELPVGVANGHV